MKQGTMFGAEFFPTPPAIIGRMLARIAKDAEYYLDPSAGRGDIAEAIQRADHYHRHRKIDCIEESPELSAVLVDKGFPVVGGDWLTYDGVCYYDAIVMNPPFSNGDAHLLKAWDWLYNGEIVCLLNAETVRNPHTAARQRLAGVIAEHGDVEELGRPFKRGARPTDVEVVLVYLRKTTVEDAAELWETKGQERDHGGEAAPDNLPAIRDRLGNLQHYYEQANHHITEAFRHIRKAAVYLGGNDLRIDDYRDTIAAACRDFGHARAEFLRKHRKDAWKAALSRTEFHKWLDKLQREELERDIERNGNIPFTAANIYGTLENIFMQRNRLFEKSVSNVFDSLRRYHADNIHHTEGWKTNSSYKVNPKVIFPWGCSFDGKFCRNFRLYHSSGMIDVYNDLDRVLCVLGGRSFDSCYTIGRALEGAFRALGHNVGSGFYNQCQSEFFDIRFFKKGTVHLVWRDALLREAFNKTAAAGRAEIGDQGETARQAA